MRSDPASLQTPPEVTVIGGGLAGCEAAWQLAERGVRVTLIEMKPSRMSPAHTTPLLGEIVCSNSLRSDDPHTPAGLLKAELRAAGSLIIACADATRVPAGDALAVDRHQFARRITALVARHPNIRLERRLVDRLPDGPCILAGGPLVEGGAAREVRRLCGDRLYFYDAIAPIVDAETLDWDLCFRASRYGTEKDQPGGRRRRGRGRRPGALAPAAVAPAEAATDETTGAAGEPGEPGELTEASAPTPCETPAAAPVEGDYINCPMSEPEYRAFVDALIGGRKVQPHRFEEPRYFEGCLPIEVMAERGPDTLAFGPMKPVGLDDPRPGAAPPFAVVQLRAENRYGTAYNLVGFQTRLAYPEQKRIFALIPALHRAEFLRFGSIHRNSYVEGHKVLDEDLALRGRPSVHLAGQITGVEGYIESTAMGLVCALLVEGKLRGRRVSPPPPATALGALYHHVRHPRAPGEPYVPMNINFGLLPPLEDARAAKKAGKHGRRVLHAERARATLPGWLSEVFAGA